MKIDIVIVTYNRLEKLKKTLKAFDEQTKLPGKIIVVNNCSTDGTNDFLSAWRSIKSNYEKVVLNLKSNIGGSGGFYEGMKNLIENKSDWIWVSDDDAYPCSDALEKAYDYLENNDLSNVSAICGQVIAGGKIDYGHRRTIKKCILSIHEIDSEQKDYEKKEFNIDLFSYVGTIMNVKKLKQVGITNKDFFIYYDDTDHSMRLRKIGNIICIPAIKVIHDVNSSNADNTYNWKTYYLFRNRLYFYKFNFKSRYYKLEKILIYLRIIKKHNKACTKLILSAIHDFNKGKMGISDTYKPGWKLKK